MQDGKQTPAKAVAAALVPLATALAFYVTTGEVNTEEISLAVSGLVAGLLTYLVSNKAKSNADHDSTTRR